MKSAVISFVCLVLSTISVFAETPSVNFSCLDPHNFHGATFDSAIPYFATILFEKGQKPGELIEKSREILLSPDSICGEITKFSDNCSATQEDGPYGFSYDFTCRNGMHGSFFGTTSDGVHFECSIPGHQPLEVSLYVCQRN